MNEHFIFNSFLIFNSKLSNTQIGARTIDGGDISRFLNSKAACNNNNNNNNICVEVWAGRASGHILDFGVLALSVCLSELIERCYRRRAMLPHDMPQMPHMPKVP
jgi:hypothetical protein